MTTETDVAPATPPVQDDLADPVLPVGEVSREEWMGILDRQARRILGISGEAFVHRWNAGHYADDPDQPGVMSVAMLLPVLAE